MADSPSTLMPFTFADSKRRVSDPKEERDQLKSYAQARRGGDVQDRSMGDVEHVESSGLKTKSRREQHRRAGTGRETTHRSIGIVGRKTGVAPPKNAKRMSSGLEDPDDYFASSSPAAQPASSAKKPKSSAKKGGAGGSAARGKGKENSWDGADDSPVAVSALTPASSAKGKGKVASSAKKGGKATPAEEPVPKKLFTSPATRGGKGKKAAASPVVEYDDEPTPMDDMSDDEDEQEPTPVKVKTPKAKKPAAKKKAAKAKAPRRQKVEEPHGDPRPAFYEQGEATPGMRRSKRQKIRPLEYWRNERVMYERRGSLAPEIVDVLIRSPEPTPFRPRRKRAAEDENPSP